MRALSNYIYWYISHLRPGDVVLRTRPVLLALAHAFRRLYGSRMRNIGMAEIAVIIVNELLIVNELVLHGY